MKKSILVLALIVCSILQARAQINKGGIPLSFQHKIEFDHIPLSHYSNPDWEGYLEREGARPDFTRPYLAGLHAAADFGFPQSGQLITLDNGNRVWRGQIAIQGAPAIGLMYDQFQLPKGVSLYAYNANRKQVLGAFDAHNNEASGVFITDAIQGNVVTLELNIDAGVALGSIKMHINKAIVFHRAVEHLAQYVTIDGRQPIADAVDSNLIGSSSMCMINAICPQSINYVNNRKASVQTLLSVDGGTYLCSGTLVNNTGNTMANCSNAYILTASHCEQTGSLSNATFDQMIIRFNYEKSGCSSAEIPTSQSMVGVNVVARSDYDTSFTTPDIKGDFMLYQLRQPIPANYNATLSGWNRNADIDTSTAEPRKFIGFHHPAGDVKKLSYAYNIKSVALGTDEMDTHWYMQLDGGYVARGSSGSGLFNPNGALIGIASVASGYNPPANCKVNAKGEQHVDAMKYVYYSRLDYDWDYSLNGANANRKLKPWLDPAHSGQATLAALNASDCSALAPTSINLEGRDLSREIAIYPNPNINGRVQVQYNFKSKADLDITVYDISGRAVHQSVIYKAMSGVRALDLSYLPNGVYVIKLRSENVFVAQKLVIQR